MFILILIKFTGFHLLLDNFQLDTTSSTLMILCAMLSLSYPSMMAGRCVSKPLHERERVHEQLHEIQSATVNILVTQPIRGEFVEPGPGTRFHLEVADPSIEIIGPALLVHQILPHVVQIQRHHHSHQDSPLHRC